MNCDCAVITHPSVRIRGTENEYTPKQCSDPNCTVRDAHMHCPFCVKTEVFHDVVILRAHYRVKHVDKGIDFSGLKILRCCSQCDIVGAIKGEKKFKGAHWHCYKCKNGFNRRDEAVKHYKTHFRNPLTTFQIHITREVNGPVQECGTVNLVPVDLRHSMGSNDKITAVNEATPDALDVSRCFRHEVDSSMENGDGSPDMDATSSKEGEEEEDGGETAIDEESQAIMIIQDNIESSPFESGHNEDNIVSIDKEITFMDDGKDLKEQLMELQRMKAELQLKNENFLDEVEQLKIQVELQAKEIENLKQREQDLLRHLMGDSYDRSQELLAALQAQHTELLQSHMLQMRQIATMQHDVTGNMLSNKDCCSDESSNVLTLIVDSRGTLMAPTKISFVTAKDVAAAVDTRPNVSTESGASGADQAIES